MQTPLVRNRTPTDRMTNPPAVATRHSYIDPQAKCPGTLYRTDTGADRLSEYSGRIVVQCAICQAQYSLSAIPKS